MFGSKNYMTEEDVVAMINPLRERIDQLETLVRQQTSALSALRVAVDEAKGQIGQLLDSHVALPSLPDDKVATGHASTSGESSFPSTFYFSMPLPEGVFVDGTTEERVGKSIYLLRTDDGLNGRFEMLSTPDAIATAMISVSQFVKPVCRVEGSTHRQPHGVVTLEKGVAQQAGGVWKVVKKATVQFL